MLSASSFSKITTMTWSGVGTPAVPAAFAPADDEDAERAVSPGSAPEEQAVSTTSARAAAAVRAALIAPQCGPAPRGRRAPPSPAEGSHRRAPRAATGHLSIGSAGDLEAGRLRVVRRSRRHQRPDPAAPRLPGATGPVAGSADGTVRLLRGRTGTGAAAGRPALRPPRPPPRGDPGNRPLGTRVPRIRRSR